MLSGDNDTLVYTGNEKRPNNAKRDWQAFRNRTRKETTRKFRGRRISLPALSQKPTSHITYSQYWRAQVPLIDVSGDYFGGSVTIPSYSRERMYSSVRSK